MKIITKWAHNFPVEFYLFLFFALGFLIYFFVLSSTCPSSGCLPRHFGISIANIAERMGLIFRVALVLLTALVFLVVRWVYFTKRRLKEIFFFLRSFVLVFGLSVLLFAVFAMSIQALFASVDPARISSVSVLLMRVDYGIFNVYPPLFLNDLAQNIFASRMVYISYAFLPAFLILGFTFTFFYSKKSFRKFILAFFTSIIISFPFWVIFPAISPNFMFMDNILKAQNPTDITSAFKQTRFTP